MTNDEMKKLKLLFNNIKNVHKKACEYDSQYGQDFKKVTELPHSDFVKRLNAAAIAAASNSLRELTVAEYDLNISYFFEALEAIFQKYETLQEEENADIEY